MVTFSDRVRSAWNAFSSIDRENPYRPDPIGSQFYNGGYSVRPDRTPRIRTSNERSIIASIYTRISIDCAAVVMRHTRHDDQDRYLADVKSGLDDCLTVEANVDQAARAFRQDMVLTLLDKGMMTIVPVDTTTDPGVSGAYDIQSMRVGDIVQFYPYHVRTNLYNERKGLRQEVMVEKKYTGIVENPLYAVMNDVNSTYQRLIRKLALLDSVDEASSSGKLDLILQLPYAVKSETRKADANRRRTDLEDQLKGSQYGVAYTDATEKVIQLNRPVENNLLNQIKLLTDQLYAQLGLTPEVMNGTADEATMKNYYSRTVEPIVAAIVEEMRRKFLTKTARSQGQTVDYFIDPFKLIPMADIAEISDKLTRNEIVTANEMRQFIGMKPSTDPKADQLVNSNMPIDKTGVDIPSVTQDPPVSEELDATPFDDINNTVTQSFADLGINGPNPVVLSPPPGAGALDHDVLMQSLDDMDAAIDETFKGLEV